MVAISPLPEPLAAGPFTTAAALELGVSRKRLRGTDLAAPFHGVRSSGEPADVHERAAAYAERMAPGHVFAGITAARLWGLPVESRWRPDEPLVIGVPAGATRTRAAGTRVRRFDPARLSSGTVRGLRTLGPVSAVMSMARETSADDLVVLIDALVTPSKRYPRLSLPRSPFTTVSELAAFAERCRGIHGASAFGAAVERARPGADSPKESQSRLVIVAAGLPEPVVQFEVWVDGVRRAVIDLAYPELKIAIEYEGDHHRTDAAQWAKDIRRQELLESLGWIVIRVTKGELRRGGRELVERVRRARERRAQSA
jgi:Protein of unknown function (DUF559)